MAWSAARDRIVQRLTPIIGEEAAQRTAVMQGWFAIWWLETVVAALPLGIAAQMVALWPVRAAAVVAGIVWVALAVVALSNHRQVARVTRRFVHDTYGFTPRLAVFQNAESAYTNLRLEQLCQAAGIPLPRSSTRFSRRRLIAAMEERLRDSGGPVPAGPPQPPMSPARR